MELCTDEQLVALYLSGSEEALRELIERYLKPVYNFVYRYVGAPGETEDIVQDVFVGAWKNIKRFDTTRKFKTWIFTIAKNTSLNWIKKKKPALFSQFETEDGENILEQSIADPMPLPDELFARSSRAEELSAVLQKLSPRYQKVLSLRYTDQLTFQEISEFLGESIHTVKSRHRRALVALKKILSS